MIKRCLVLLLSVCLFISSSVPCYAAEKDGNLENLKSALRVSLEKVNAFYAGPYGKAIVGVSIGALYVATKRYAQEAAQLKRDLFNLRYTMVHELERVPLGVFGEEYVKVYGEALSRLQENYMYHAPQSFTIKGMDYVLREGQENAYLREVQLIVNKNLEKYKPSWDLLIVRGDTPEITFARMVNEITKEIQEGIVKERGCWPIIFKASPVSARGFRHSMKGVIGSVGKKTLWLLPLLVFVSSSAQAAETQKKIERIYQNPSLILTLSEEEWQGNKELQEACYEAASQVHELAQMPEEQLAETVKEYSCNVQTQRYTKELRQTLSY